MKASKCVVAAMIALLITAVLSLGVLAEKVDFEYKLRATDENGYEVTDLRSLPAGSKFTVEIEVSRNDIPDPSYMVYGLEIRLHDLGLTYNKDGASFRAGTDVRELNYESGDSVGFAFYDMKQEGERVNNPVLGGKWSYTVDDPSIVNIKVPVAIMYVPDDGQGHEIIGNAHFRLDPKGGVIDGDDPSGEYSSGTVITLPSATFGDFIFIGWSDGFSTYYPGDKFAVSGFITLTAVWEEVDRERQIIFDLKGGEMIGADPSGMYADDEKIVLPEAEKDGFRLVAWSDGVNEYKPGDEYTVYNSVVITALWEPADVESSTEPVDEPGGDTPGKNEYPDRTGLIAGLIAIGVVLLGAAIWWLIILWKRRWVLYSLKTGDIALSFKDDDHDAQIRVVALDDDRHVILGTSGRVERGKRLRFIHGVGEIAEIEKGKYKGRLLVADGDYRDIIKVRVKVLDRELRERKND